MLKKRLQLGSANLDPTVAATQSIRKINQRDIAIIGIALQFPSANGTEQFWGNLSNGLDCMKKLPQARLADIQRYFSFKGLPIDEVDLLKGEAGFLEELDKFDYGFFRLSPKEAQFMDPNQRLFLQTAWSAIEDAGYGGDRLKGSRTGVFVGFSSEAEYKRMVAEVDASDLTAAMTGNLNSMLPSRISYLLNLHGPSMLIDTSCSSSLVSVHLACQSIRNNECDMALAGGVQTHIIPIRQTKVGIESSNNRTRTFDESSDGTGTGEGVAAILLKPLYKAMNDRDVIYAVIKGSAINQDGNSISLTAPNTAAQEDVIVRAWRDADVDPATISYIETHGTGTKLGDPIEIEGIRRAFSRYTDRKQFCAVSAVKSNIGHLDNSAGIAGLIKAVLALQHKKLPPTLHVRRTNRNIAFEDSPVYVNDRLTEWESEGVRRCGVSSFAISGTNCHIVLEEAPPSKPNATEHGKQIFTLSARSLTSLRRGILNYQTLLTQRPDISLADLCFTVNTGRSHWEYRLALVAENIEELRSKLQLTSTQDSLKTMGGESIFYGECRLSSQAEKQMVKADLGNACRNYVEGADIDWGFLYEGKSNKRIPLPTYPFERNRCWLEIPETQEPFYFETRWQKSAATYRKKDIPFGITLILHDNSLKATELIDFLRSKNERIIEVRVGDQFCQIDADQFVIGHDEKDYSKLMESMLLSKLGRVIHAMTLNPEHEIESLEDLQQAQELGFYSLLHLSKALSLSALGHQVELVILSSYAQHVHEKQQYLHPHHTALFGLGKVIRWEEPMLQCRCIDIDMATSISQLANEMESDESEFQVAYRSGERFVERLAALADNQQAIEEIEIRENGVYVITGGLGNLGLKMARHLASKNNVHLVLINRFPIPLRSEWEKLLSKGNDVKRCKQISAIQAIEALGSHVHAFAADITDYEQLEKVLADVRAQYGNITGLIHCAGIGVGMSGMPIREDSRISYEAVMAPKVQGTWNLARATEQDELDFSLFFSSVITLIGSVGSGSYTAANAYLDSFSAFARRRGRKAITVNWPYWIDQERQGEGFHEEKELFRFLKPDEALMALDRILSSRIDRVIVGRLNDQSSLFRLGDYLPLKLSEDLCASLPKAGLQPGARPSANRNSVRLKGTTNPETVEIEKKVASVWQEVLGFDELNVVDNFFEIGGDSILITKVHALLEEEYAGGIRISDLFAYPTIAKLAAFLASQQSIGEDKPEEMRESILRLVEQMEQGKMSLEQVVKEYHLLEVQT
ncbi:SDR family oxidoreductase [Paenibacillus sp. chi10]|uniref:SDR family oxidoreductase n=1 Tax=Paenibacillus suaedae TaxID=3077233 RepID=A0AAJ2N907_9BACL|nr:MULTISPECIES: type I polyketide synthase [unclassified Paenibacillus]MDT8977084.1 SDR family oxidoreductase [Paenibacillus sp. chi10]GAV15989.1 beta-ketoacyl synthase family protein,phosphopantetheine-containing protein [Paenibacillus sp. NAIST15-1]